MDFTGYAFDPVSIVAFYAGSWLLGLLVGGIVAALFGVVGRRGG